MPVPGEAPRRAWRVEMVLDAETAYSVHVDAVTGEVLARENLVDADSDNPRWKVFTGTPLTDRSPTDIRKVFCWTAAAGCDEAVASPASPKAWDVDPATNLSTQTTNGNNAFTFEQWRSTQGATATASPERTYVYPWTNSWQENKCDPATYTNATRNDIDAATANLFAMHNRMHDWSYRLGFTETAWNAQRDNYGKGGLGGDPEIGRSQSGAQIGLRNNANQLTLSDGSTVSSNMYMWQPVAGSFYAPCVDGSFDMSVIGHEYGHAISNRMAGGPAMGLSGLQAGAMGESWSDLMAMEYLQENGYATLGGEATPMGAYVTGNPTQGIRNFNMGNSPLNYSNVGYDLTGPQVHADGEIWSATNNDVRNAFIGRYGLGDAATQKACADGQRAVTACPGNRRWIQLVFDAWLLMPSGAVSMVDARDRMLAADLLRFGGANQDLLWNAFAVRGLGDRARRSATSADSQSGAELRLAVLAQRDAALLPDRRGRSSRRRREALRRRLHGPFARRGRHRPGDTAHRHGAHRPGRAVVHRDGTRLRPHRGDARPPSRTRPGTSRCGCGPTSRAPLRERRSRVRAPTSPSSSTTTRRRPAPRSTPRRPRRRPSPSTSPEAARSCRRVQVSALPGARRRRRFQALRQFQVLACDAKGRVDCSRDADYRPVFTSPADAFPAGVPRPTAPSLNMRSFDVPQVNATHLRFVVLANQCEGGPRYQGEQDEDPANATDCDENYTGAGGAHKVGITEVQAFRR